MIFRLGFAVAACCLISGVARGQSFTRVTNDAWDGNQLASTFDHIIVENTGHVAGTTGQEQMFWWDSYGRVRFNRNDDRSPFVAYRVLTIDDSADNRVNHSTMDEIDLALGLHLGTIGGWDVATVLGAGYSGTHPFVDDGGVFGIGDILFQHSLDKDNSLLLSVDYTGNSGLLPDVPLPGFAVIHKTEKLDFSLGYPKSKVQYRPLSTLTLSAEYDVPFTANLDLQYVPYKHFGVYANAGNFFQGIVIEGHGVNDRQFYQMRRVEAGIRFLFNPLVDATIGGGYAFDQGFSRGFDVRSLRPTRHISNEPFLAITLRGTF